jgi:hypothetical protein
MMKAPGALLAQKSLVAPELHRSRVGIGSESEARQMGFRLDTPKRFRVTPDSLPLLQRGSTAASRRLGPCDPGHRRRVTERVIWFLRAAKPLRQAGSAGTAAACGSSLGFARISAGYTKILASMTSWRAPSARRDGGRGAFPRRLRRRVCLRLDDQR